MRPSRIVFYTALTIVGGTIAARHIKSLGKVPGFSPQG